MALKSIVIKESLLRKIMHFFSVTKLTYLLIIIAITSGISSLYAYNRVQQIAAFNQAISDGKPPKTDKKCLIGIEFLSGYARGGNIRRKDDIQELPFMLDIDLNLKPHLSPRRPSSQK